MADMFAYIVQVWEGFLAQDPLTQATTVATVCGLSVVGVAGWLYRSMLSSKQKIIDAEVKLAEARAKQIKELEAENAALLREAPRGWLERAAHERRDGNEIKAITALRLRLESAAPDLAACCLDLAEHHLAFLDHELPAHLPSAERYAKLAVLHAPDDRRARTILEEIVEIRATIGSTASDSADVTEAENFLEPEPGMDAEETVDALCQASYGAADAGSYHRAERLARRAVLIGKHHLSETAPLTLNARYYRARALTLAGNAVEALLPVEERVLSAEHPDVLAVRGLKADILIGLGRHQEALTEVEALLPLRERVLGLEHPNVLATRRLRAQVLIKVGRYEAALTEVEALLPVQERVLDLEHRGVLNTCYLHAQVLDYLGQYEEALEEMETLRPRYEQALGIEHPEVLAMRR